MRLAVQQLFQPQLHGIDFVMKYVSRARVVDICRLLIRAGSLDAD